MNGKAFGIAFLRRFVFHVEILPIIGENQSVMSLLPSPALPSQEHFHDHDYKEVPFTILFSVLIR